MRKDPHDLISILILATSMFTDFNEQLLSITIVAPQQDAYYHKPRLLGIIMPFILKSDMMVMFLKDCDLSLRILWLNIIGFVLKNLSELQTEVSINAKLFVLRRYKLGIN